MISENAMVISEDAPVISEDARVISEDAPGIPKDVPVISEDAPVISEDAPVPKCKSLVAAKGYRPKSLLSQYEEEFYPRLMTPVAR